MSEEKYEKVLQGANEADLDVLETIRCVQIRADQSNVPTIVVMPSLALDALSPKRYNLSEADILKKAYYLFVKMVEPLRTKEYNIIYVHSEIITVFGNRSMLNKGYSRLTRDHKKNLKNVYVVHPNSGLRWWFEYMRLSFSSKLFKKLQFFTDIADIQAIINPAHLTFPVPFHVVDDQNKNIKYRQGLQALDKVYHEELHCPEIVARCASFIRKFGITNEGIFRKPGNNELLQMALARVEMHASELITFLAPEDYTAEDKEYSEDKFVRYMSHIAAPSSSSDSSKKGKGEGEFSRVCIVTIRCPLIAAQMFKASLRDLPEPVITYKAYGLLMQLPAATATEEHVLLEAITMILNDMPRAHMETLKFVLQMLKDVAEKEEENKMPVQSLANIFAPTLMKAREQDQWSTAGSDGADMRAMNDALIGINKAQNVLKILIRSKLGLVLKEDGTAIDPSTVFRMRGLSETFGVADPNDDVIEANGAGKE